MQGGFKFQVQRVNDDPRVHRLPAAWRSSDICSGARSGDGVQLARHVLPQVGALAQLLVQQPSGDVIGAALPGAVRIGKQDLDREPLHQGADGRTISSPLEEVAFPVTGSGWTASRGLEI
jgi:hypothetical protein